MQITQTLYVTKAEQWRKWLQNNYHTAKEIWLINPNKASGRPRLSYNASVEEALCFGWIDSIVKKLDKDSSVQRFTPRNPKTPYSQTNIERLHRLAEQNKLMPEVKEAVKNILTQPFIFPDDIIKAIKANKTAWQNYQNFSPTYKRVRVAFIEGARTRPEEFNKRLNYFISMSEKNKLFGFGGIEEYF